jgi:uncharacterized membrane-anchored protein
MRLLIALLCLLPAITLAQDNDRLSELRKLQWQSGPGEGRIGKKATITLPQGYVFLNEKDTSRFLELAGNPPRPGHYLFAPESLKWWSVFTFEDTGYVKDDEKIDPDDLLKSMKEGDEPSNKERKRLGMPAIYTDGWQVPPHYDTESKRLEWGTRLRSGDSGELVVNYTARLLGRSGVMSGILVSSPEALDRNAQEFRASLKDFNYVPGERYAEYKQGDKVAEYGLAALILGGAAAVATKKGFWAAIVAFMGAFWKIVAGVGVAALAGLKSLFKPKT